MFTLSNDHAGVYEVATNLRYTDFERTSSSCITMIKVIKSTRAKSSSSLGLQKQLELPIERINSGEESFKFSIVPLLSES